MVNDVRPLQCQNQRDGEKVKIIRLKINENKYCLTLCINSLFFTVYNVK